MQHFSETEYSRGRASLGHWNALITTGVLLSVCWWVSDVYVQKLLQNRQKYI